MKGNNRTAAKRGFVKTPLYFDQINVSPVDSDGRVSNDVSACFLCVSGLADAILPTGGYADYSIGIHRRALAVSKRTFGKFINTPQIDYTDFNGNATYPATTEQEFWGCI